jgi:hypothetical protein
VLPYRGISRGRQPPFHAPYGACRGIQKNNICNYKHTQHHPAIGATMSGSAGPSMPETISKATQGRRLHCMFVGGCRHTSLIAHPASSSKQAANQRTTRNCWYNKKVLVHNQMLSSRRVPATNDARVTSPGPEASSPTQCRSFIVGWPNLPCVSTKKGKKP